MKRMEKVFPIRFLSVGDLRFEYIQELGTLKFQIAMIYKSFAIIFAMNTL